MKEKEKKAKKKEKVRKSSNCFEGSLSRLLQVVVVLLVPVAAPEEDVSVVVHVVETKQGVELAGCRIKRVEAQSVALKIVDYSWL